MHHLNLFDQIKNHLMNVLMQKHTSVNWQWNTLIVDAVFFSAPKKQLINNLENLGPDSYANQETIYSRYSFRRTVYFDSP